MDAVLRGVLWCVAQTPCSGLPSVLILSCWSVGGWWVSAELHPGSCPSSEKACRRQLVADPWKGLGWSIVNGHSGFWLRFCCSCSILSFINPASQQPHRCWAQGTSPIRFPHACLYFRVCFLSNLDRDPGCRIWLDLWTQTPQSCGIRHGTLSLMLYSLSLKKIISVSVWYHYIPVRDSNFLQCL